MQLLKLLLIRHPYIPEWMMPMAPLPPGELLDRGTLSVLDTLSHLESCVLPFIQPSLRPFVVADELPGAFGRTTVVGGGLTIPTHVPAILQVQHSHRIACAYPLKVEFALHTTYTCALSWNNAIYDLEQICRRKSRCRYT
jgi:hypothetical protein